MRYRHGELVRIKKGTRAENGVTYKFDRYMVGISSGCYIYAPIGMHVNKIIAVPVSYLERIAPACMFNKEV